MTANSLFCLLLFVCFSLYRDVMQRIGALRRHGRQHAAVTDGTETVSVAAVTTDPGRTSSAMIRICAGQMITRCTLSGVSSQVLHLVAPHTRRGPAGPATPPLPARPGRQGARARADWYLASSDRPAIDTDGTRRDD